jgi:hypothetical protein
VKKAVTGVVLVLALGTAAYAGLYNFKGTPVDLVSWTGTGENESIMVLDFGDDSYAFGYRWSDSATGYSMLDAIAAETDVDFTYTDWGGGFIAVDTISYNSSTMVSGFHVYPYTWPDDWMSYWIGDDGESWAASEVGANSRDLTDGAWDGWSAEAGLGGGPDGYDPITQPNTPVPEPGAMGLLALGASLMAWRARCRMGTSAS